MCYCERKQKSKKVGRPENKVTIGPHIPSLSSCHILAARSPLRISVTAQGGLMVDRKDEGQER